MERMQGNGMGIDIGETVGAIAAKLPASMAVFDELGIDYCCGGNLPLEEVCRAQGLDPAEVVARFAAGAGNGADAPDPATMGLAELADHIEAAHHGYLWDEMPRLRTLADKVARAHGEGDPRLKEVRDVFAALADEMEAHMEKEERILFPMVRALERAAAAPVFHCGSLANPIRQMNREHDSAGAALERLRLLTDGYAVPAWACNSYTGLLEALERFEADMRLHVQKENGFLFPRALELESRKPRA
jgi:regulator of cell morphogenesis and NO signaling